jgi:hypothetical protein
VFVKYLLHFFFSKIFLIFKDPNTDFFVMWMYGIKILVFQESGIPFFFSYICNKLAHVLKI